jgi:ribosomal protein L7/L12
MDSNLEILIRIFTDARKIGNVEIAKEAIIAIAKDYGIAPPSARYKSLKDINLYTELSSGNRIRAIKELRERAMENGLSYGLMEAREEVDRRISAAKYQATDRW